MLSPPTVWPFSVAADINSNVFDFYFLIWSLSRLLCCIGSGFNVVAALGYGYIGARNDRTQQSGQTPDKEVEVKHITVYDSGYTETDTTGMLSPQTVWRQQSEFVSSRQSGQILAAVRKGFERRCNGQNCRRLKCSHTFLQCMPRQMLVCCVG
jgi:hypothetical protein